MSFGWPEREGRQGEHSCIFGGKTESGRGREGTLRQERVSEGPSPMENLALKKE